MFLHLELFLQLLSPLLITRKFPGWAILDGLSSRHFLDISGPALVEDATLGNHVGTFQCVGEVTINDLQLDIFCSPDAVDCLGRPELRATVDGFYSVQDVFCCDLFCRLDACGS
jgi:hypothetical protein